VRRNHAKCTEITENYGANAVCDPLGGLIHNIVLRSSYAWVTRRLPDVAPTTYDGLLFTIDPSAEDQTFYNVISAITRAVAR
jgi:hypothetical protein